MKATSKLERPATAGQPFSEGNNSQDRLQVLHDFIVRHFFRLINHTQRQLAFHEAAGDIEEDRINATEILDEVIRICLEHPERKPGGLAYELWLYQLIGEALDRECRDLAAVEKDRVEFPNDEPLDNEQNLCVAMAQNFELDESLDEEHFADPAAIPPDLALEEIDLMKEIQAKIVRWPRNERRLFDLHFLDGLEAAEIAMVEKMEPAEVERKIEVLHDRLRKLVRPLTEWAR